MVKGNTRREIFEKYIGVKKDYIDEKSNCEG